ncbi:hypothetical protein Dimus_024800, partial [Dionaea muscipula]
MAREEEGVDVSDLKQSSSSCYQVLDKVRDVSPLWTLSVSTSVLSFGCISYLRDLDSSFAPLRETLSETRACPLGHCRVSNSFSCIVLGRAKAIVCAVCVAHALPRSA